MSKFKIGDKVKVKLNNTMRTIGNISYDEDGDIIGIFAFKRDGEFNLYYENFFEEDELELWEETK